MQYALKIRKTDLALITFLNGGVEPEIENRETYLIFQIDGPDEITTDIVTKREMLNTGEISGFSPLLIKFKKS